MVLLMWTLINVYSMDNSGYIQGLKKYYFEERTAKTW